MFERLIVSSPNGGGLFYVDGSDVYRLDGLSTTGLTYFEGQIARGVQPSTVNTLGKYMGVLDGGAGGFGDVHDVLFFEEHLYLVGTTGNEILKFTNRGEEVDRWSFPGEDDSWHINCLGVWNGRVVFSAFGEFRGHREYKGRTVGAGFVQDLLSGRRLILGLSQPHSLVQFGENLLVANSEHREVVEFSPSGRRLKGARFDGYVRGICVADKYIYIGLSCSRNIEYAGVSCSTIVALEPATFREKGRVAIPAKEIYDILQIRDGEALGHTLAALSSSSAGQLENVIRERDRVISSLTETISSVLIERDAYKGAMSDVENCMRQEQVARKEADETVRRLLTERDGYREAVRGLEEQVRVEQAAREEVGEAVRGLITERDAYRDAMHSLEGQVRLERAGREEVVGAMGGLMVERDAYKNATVGLEEQLRLEQVGREELAGAVGGLTLERDRYKSAMLGLDEQLRLEQADRQKVLSESSREIENQRLMLEECRAEIAVLSARCDTYAAELARVYLTWSWRITLPLRRVKLLLKKGRGGNCGQLSTSRDPAPSSAQPNSTASAPKEVSNTFAAVHEVERAAIQIEFNDTPRCSILLVSYYCPTRAHAGGLRILDIYGLIRQKCPTVRIDLLTHHRPAVDWSIDEVHQLFDNVYLSPGDELTLDVLKGLVGQELPRYDVVDLQFHQSGYQLEGYRKIGSKVLFTPMESQAKVLYLDLCDQITKHRRIQLRRIFTQVKLAYEEITFCRKADEVVCVSRTDAAFIRAVGGGGRIRGIETGLSALEFASALADDFVRVKACNRTKTVIYVAYFGSETNVTALRWYLETVHPMVVHAVPDYKLVVVGRGDLSSFKSYEGKNVELVGEVPALEPFIRRARVGIAPALGGSGFRGKVNQYAVLGTPAVASSIALKGLAYRDGENISVADNAAAFADGCIRLLIDDEWNDRMAEGARKLCLERYTWTSKWMQIKTAYSLHGVESC